MLKKGKHKTELGDVKFKRSVCREPKCKFFGQPAQQGICHTALSDARTRYIDIVLKQGEACLAAEKRLRKVNNITSDKAWIKYLEGHFVCNWANIVFGLDELIYLRAENSRLRHAAGRNPRS